MATTLEDLKNQDDEYSAAFAEPEQEKPEVSEDEAFGLLPEPAEDGASTPSEEGASEEAPVVSITAEEPAEEEPTEKPAMTKDQQREASWEGRLKAREAELKKPADIAPATEFSPSGAPRQVTDIDVSHPAVDNDPRAETTIAQNKADFNDPGLSMEEAVAEQLKKGGSGVVLGDEGKKDA